MKSNSSKLIRILKLCIDVAWFGNFVLTILAVGFLGYELMFNQYVETSMQVRVPRQELTPGIKVRAQQAKEVHVMAQEASLTFEMKNTAWNAALSIFLFLAIEGLIFSILYHLRKLFRNLKMGFPFSTDNVSSLKRVGFFVALIYPLQFLLFVFQQFVIARCFNTNLTAAFDPNINILIIAAVIYVLAEIFNHGLDLKKENEEFV